MLFFGLSHFIQSTDAAEDLYIFDFNYSPELIIKEGWIPSSLDNVLKEEKLFKHKKTKIHNVYALTERIKCCTKAIKNWGKEFGFFDIESKFTLKPLRNQREVAVKLEVKLGRRYKLNKIDVIFKDKKENIKDLSGCYKNSENKVFNVVDIIEIAKRLEDDLQNNGYPNAEVVKKDLYLLRDSHAVNVQYVINLGPKVYFGQTKIAKDFDISEDFIRNRILWNTGRVYDKRLVQMSSYMLSSSQIFSDVDINFEEQSKDTIVGENFQKIPILIKLQEEKPRLLELNLTYATDKQDGFFKKNKSPQKLRSLYGKIKWTRYNLFGNGERLSLGASGVPYNVVKKNVSNNYELFSEFEIPDSIVPCDNILYSGKTKQVFRNAYYKKSQVVSAIWTVPPISQDVKLQVGISTENNNVTNPYLKADEIEEACKKYNALLFPMVLILDKRDSVLNPTKGYKISTVLIPEFFSSGMNDNATLAAISGTNNWDLNGDKKNIFSVQCNVKHIFGMSSENIPYDKRLYSGGMNSIRGFGSQMAGQLLRKTKYPIGGTSLMELRNEFRHVISKEIGVVAFLETANLSSGRLLKSKKWYTGYGFGVRYNTVVGPVRFDVAFPAKKRRNQDRQFHFYISLGQAF